MENLIDDLKPLDPTGFHVFRFVHVFFLPRHVPSLNQQNIDGPSVSNNLSVKSLL